jgi:glycosyltransferase involved in cell wall biosynthesis
MTPTLHVLAMPHTQTTKEYGHCAYTQRVRKFTSMMTAQGYKTILYAGNKNEADCTELVKVMVASKQCKLLKGEDWYKRGEIYALPYDENAAIWRAYNEAAIREIGKRIEAKDIICLASGTHALVMRAFPNHMSVETGVGYEGTCAPYRVFESYAWMAAVYGHQQGAAQADGRFYDAVIPNFFEVEDFPAGGGDGGYFLFMSRMTPRKGYEVAIEATRRAGAKLLIAGIGGDCPQAEHVEYVGLADTKKRAELMGGAKAIFVPTLYLEPFGGVVVEAALCGTPAITTDWGSFPELVEQGVMGYRCRRLGEFQWAAEHAGELDRDVICERAIRLYSTETVGPMYARYFEHLSTLFGDGFYDETPREPLW